MVPALTKRTTTTTLILNYSYQDFASVEGNVDRLREDRNVACGDTYDALGVDAARLLHCNDDLSEGEDMDDADDVPASSDTYEEEVVDNEMDHLVEEDAIWMFHQKVLLVVPDVMMLK
jgi:hypothetical protein